ncbi:putative quinol monooxygenase [Hydrogenophaga sp. PAMC20947]|uniref:putative quinol monooxygenase n=1 Tax=Hydrogenophaga sp. PAMC20947 TaxID=2565558 RepID=UPI00109E2F51|nr:putative quinol monooxygenase [Hydrogenophaga sp. PAMC20947]QCB45283.1 antibiotic biosynthesis monooxygenase [Hydrogenophaga sp. PAMC20947]
MHYVLARITVQPGASAQTATILETLVSLSRQEAGCVSYELYQQADHPHVFQTVEVWRDAEAAQTHMSTPHLAAAVAEATPLFAAPPEILAYQKLA